MRERQKGTVYASTPPQRTARRRRTHNSGTRHKTSDGRNGDKLDDPSEAK